MQIYSELLQLVDDQGYNLLDVHSCRTNIAGNKEESIDWINRNCNPSFLKVQGNFEKRASQSGDSFVPMELDLQENNERRATTDSGYLSKHNTEDLTTVRGESELGAVGGRLVPEAAESGSEDTINAPPAERIISAEEEDIFTEKPWDEQIKSSYKFIDRTAPKSERGGVRAPVSSEAGLEAGAGGKAGIGAGWGKDWEHVRQDLQRKFGDDYYAGLRGDYILGQLQGRLKAEDEDDEDNHSRGVEGAAREKSEAPVPASQAPSAPVTAPKSGSVTARKPVTVASNLPPVNPVHSGRVISADIHSPSPISTGSGKIASINKSTNRRSAPPVPLKSCAQQYHQQVMQIFKSSY